MASNSDSLYNVLTKIIHHPEIVLKKEYLYTNTVLILIKDTVNIADVSYYFPENKFRVNRLADEFVAKNGEILEHFFQETATEALNYHDVWITTSAVRQQRAYLIELSYE